MDDPHDRLFKLLLDKDAITWQTLLQELVKNEAMDPWDIDVSVIAKRYIDMLKKLKEMDFMISGKVVLAAALLLKMKSSRLIGEDISELDRLMSPQDEFDEEAFYEDIASGQRAEQDTEIQPLLPRAPQPRKRKVSIYDLIGALQKALEVKERRVLRHLPRVKMDVPEKKVDISKLIDRLYARIVAEAKKNTVTFHGLVTEQTKEDKVLTIIPLLHLAHIDQRKINLLQNEQFGEIEVQLNVQGIEKRTDTA